MSWREQLQPAKFRDAPFSVKSAEGTAGRRTAKHEYPQREDAPFVEDMGLRAREFTLEAFVIGASYMSWRDALLYAIETPGPGMLVHPYRGSIKVSVTECRYTESSEYGGMAKFHLTFCETSENIQPDSKVDTPAQVDSAADAAHAEVTKEFGDKFKVAGMPAFVGTAALANVSAALESVRKSILSGLPDMAILPAFTWELTHMINSVQSLIALPGDLATRFTDQVSALLSIFPSRHAYSSTSSISGSSAGSTSLASFGTGMQSVPLTTPARTQQAANQDAVINLVRNTTLIEAARASSQIEFVSLNEAQTVRDQLVTRFDAQMLTAPDAVYAVLASLKSAVVRDITVRGADLAQVVSYTPRTTLPALVVAHQLYGDATRADEIVARNHIRHPGFVPGGRALEVLA
ncbi:MAG: DNA circularization N-terminal domain-containing protein [Gallionella sp.]|jgi:prophage DNA circulation protein